MTTVTDRQPLQFWSSGSDVLARVGCIGVHIDTKEQEDLLAVFEDERRAAEAAKDSKSWVAIIMKASQLKQAQKQAARWSQASGFAA